MNIFPATSHARAAFSFAAIAFGLLAAQAAPAQAPAGAPAGASGICKDGTYSTASQKDGACRGHKGVQTWYKAVPGGTPSMPAPKPAPTASSMPAPRAGDVSSMPAPAANPAPAARAMPAPTPAAAPSMPPPVAANAPAAMPAPKQGGSMKSMSPAARAASTPVAADGGPGLVWVNTTSKVYHCPGSDFYGKTKSGAYMSEADAKAQGAHANRNKPCS